MQSVEECGWIDAEGCLDKLRNNIAVQQSVMKVGDGDAMEGDGCFVLHFPRDPL